MPNTRFNNFYRYEELTHLLKDYAKEYPNLIRLESIGKSYEGREVWLVTVTNFKSGSDAEKPAFWVDGNIHASEVTASAAALYLIRNWAKWSWAAETICTRGQIHLRSFWRMRSSSSRIGWCGTH